MIFGLASTVGSPADFALLTLWLIKYRHDIAPTQARMAAAIVAIAKRVDGVRGDRLQDELDVDDVGVRAIVDDGGDSS